MLPLLFVGITPLIHVFQFQFPACIHVYICNSLRMPSCKVIASLCFLIRADVIFHYDMCHATEACKCIMDIVHRPFLMFPINERPPLIGPWNTLQWCHNESDGVLNHQHLNCLLKHFFMRRSKKYQSSKSLAFVRGIQQWLVDSPHKGPVTWINVSIWWHHHV